MDTFHSFLQQLKRLEWSPPGHIDPAILPLLAELGGQKQLVAKTVASWSSGLDRRQLRCHDTATHFKWFVYYSKKFRYKVWLHQYKIRAERRIGYAEVPHNHRYSLASAILRGGFVHHSYAQENEGLVELVSARRSLGQGNVYTVPWSEIHRLGDLVDNTLTLVVESPAVSHHSEAFYDGGEPRVFMDFVELHSRLIGVFDSPA